jgi:dephospho-CoA kinase
MIVLGLTGSIAMGKSEVADVFRQEGIPVYDADRDVHTLYDSREGVALIAPFAPTATVAGHVDRKILTQLVLNDPQLLEKLETIVHNKIAKRRAQFLKDAREQNHGMVLLDLPLLFEKASEREVDLTIVVTSPTQSQHSRALARSGMTEEKLQMILKRQMPDAEKRQRADFIIENDGSLLELHAKARALLQRIKKEHSL